METILEKFSKNPYKFAYFLSTVLTVLLIVKYFYNSIFNTFIKMLLHYFSPVPSILKFVAVFLFIFGNMEFIIFIFLGLISIFPNRDNDIYLMGSFEKFRLSYSYMWITIGYFFVFKYTYSIKDLIRIKNIFCNSTNITLLFFILSIFSFLTFIFDMLRYLVLPLNYEEIFKDLFKNS